MNRLNRKQIALIDAYLKSLNLKYYEERLEITDHVASHIEAEFRKDPEAKFYDVFYDYMDAHKADIKRNGKISRRMATKCILIRILKNLFHPLVFIFSAGLFFVYRQLPLQQWNESLAPAWIMMNIGLLFALWIFFTNLNYRHYLRIEKLFSTALFGIFTPLLLKPWIDVMSLADQILMAGVFWFGAALVFTSLKVSSEYKARFKLA